MEDRKNIRLREYDYSQNGVYFVTICTRNKINLFWDKNEASVVGAGIARPQEGYTLSETGKIAEDGINRIPEVYRINLDKYVVMPNHIHLLLSITENDGRAMLAPTENVIKNNEQTILVPTENVIKNSKQTIFVPTENVSKNSGQAMSIPAGNADIGKISSISNIIQQYKGYVTKKAGIVVWQKSFYDHIVRNRDEYLNIWNYIDTNPLKWTLDEYYKEE